MGTFVDVRVASVCLLAVLGCSPTSPSSRINPDVWADGPMPVPLPTWLDRQLEVCPTEAELADVADIRVVFGGATASGPLACTRELDSANLTEYQERVYQALLAMRRLRYNKPLPWTDRPLYDWFARTVVSVEVEYGVGNSFADIPRRTIHIVFNPPLGPPAHPDLPWIAVERLAGAMIHEARHLDFGPHTCGTTLDRTVAEMGAFGAHNAFFTWNAEWASPGVLPSEYRVYDLWVACTQRKSAFCDEPKEVRCQ